MEVILLAMEWLEPSRCSNRGSDPKNLGACYVLSKIYVKEKLKVLEVAGFWLMLS